MRRAGAFVSVLCLAAATGCVKHYDLQRNAPGNIDVLKPPTRRNHKLEKPNDPGENLAGVELGVFAGGGFAAFGVPSGLRGAYGVGPELTVLYGTNSRSHAEDDFVIFPSPGFGLNFGWTMLTYAGKGLGPLYAEFQYTGEGGAYGFAAGWAYDVNDQWHGPQGTMSVGPLYLRGTYLKTNGFDFQIGLDLKAGLLWVWSR